MLMVLLIAAGCLLPAQTILVNPSALNVTHRSSESSPASESLVVTSSNGGAVPFLAASNSPWISVSPSSGSTPATLTVKLKAQNLSPGIFRGSVVVQVVGGSVVSIPVTLTIVAFAPQLSGVYFVPIRPCRLADTRATGFTGAFGRPVVNANTVRDFPVPQGTCGIPFNAAAYSLNITAIPSSGRLAYLTVWPTGTPQSGVSTLNSFDGSVVSNAAIVPVGANGSISLYVTDSSDVVIDVNGYFTSASTAQALVFYPVQPCRVADTRNAAGVLGGPVMEGGTVRDFPVRASPCGIPATALAYSLNMTVVPRGPLAYLAVYPAAQPRPEVSTLNSFDGSVKANEAIVPAGANGDISVYVTGRSDVIIDINGYFGPPGAGGLRFFPVTPCRIIDTRLLRVGSLTVRAGKSFDVPLSVAGCSISNEAKAYSVNVTAVPLGPLAYLTVWPSGTAQPAVSTLNSFQGKVIANASLVPAGLGGAVTVFVTDTSYFILDVNGYFAP